MPPGVTGTLRTHESVSSSRGRTARRRLAAAGLREGPARRYPVLYMHDGQNLFDPALSYIGVDWGVDEAMTRLTAEGRSARRSSSASGTRRSASQEYMPAKAVSESLPDDWPDMAWMPEGEHRLGCLPALHRRGAEALHRRDLPHAPGRDDTFIMGSSMGALISLYALAEYPGRLRRRRRVSTHWPIGDGIVIDYLAPHLPARGRHRIYFDYGTATLDASYEPYQRRVDALMRAAGWREGTTG